jgi:hypothetical protein
MAVKFSFATLEQPFEADWPVKVQVPKDGGGFEEQTFLARFRLEPATDEAQTEPAAPGESFPFLVALGKGEPELTPELRKQLAARLYVRMAIYRAWQEFQMGVVAKN